jgi:hypothetical protein
LTDLSATIVGLFFLIYAYKYKKLEYFKNYFFYYFCFVFFYLNIISLFSFDPKISLGVSLPFLRIILFIISLSFFFSEYKDLKFNILYIYIICLFLLFVDSIFQLFSGYNLFGFKMNDISRISSFFRDKYVMGSFVVRLLPLFIAISFFITNKKKQNILSISILILSGLLVVLSGERVSFFYYLTLIFFYFFFLKNGKILIVYFLFFISLLVTLSFYNPNFINRIFKHTFAQLNEVQNFYNISYRHNLHYMTAYNIFLDNKLFGAGLKSFRYLCDNEKYSFSVKQKILEDNIVRSEFDGKFIIEKNSDETSLLVIDKDDKKVMQRRNFSEKYNKDHLINDLNKFRDVIYKIRFGKRKTSETSSKGSKSSINSKSSRKSGRIFATRDKASGITKRKTKKIVKNTQLGNSFKRRPKQKRFKNPIFLTIK